MDRPEVTLIHGEEAREVQPLGDRYHARAGQAEP
jgi:hypothetical protein